MMHAEHEKLRAIHEKSQAIGLFLEWLQGQGIVLARYHQHEEACYEPGKFGSSKNKNCGLSENELSHADTGYGPESSIMRLLAIYFEIDLEKLEDEKRSMLAALRKEAR